MTAPRMQEVGRFLVLSMFAAGILLPFVSVLLASFHPSGRPVDGFSVPGEWSWENFRLAWQQAGFNRLVRNSLVIVAWTVPLVLVLSVLAAYGLRVLRPPGARVISTVFILGLTLPIELVAVALYFNLRSLDLTNSFTGLVLAEIGIFLPFGVFWMQNQFGSVPTELLEAAKVDGAGDLIILRKVLVPVSWHAIATLGVLVFMWSWNHFLLIVILIQDPERRTAPAGLGIFVGQYSTNVPLLSAASLIVIGPIVLVYLLFQRSFIAGVTQGAVKG